MQLLLLLMNATRTKKNVVKTPIILLAVEAPSKGVYLQRSKVNLFRRFSTCHRWGVLWGAHGVVEL